MMRIVLWNCHQAFHCKHVELAALRPDVAIVPECAEPSVVAAKARDFACSDADWIGNNNPHKGLAVFAFNGLTLRRHASWTNRFHVFLPLELSNGYALVAVWAFNYEAPLPGRPTMRDAIAHYAPFLRDRPAIVAGDFNSNVCWDASGRLEPFAPLNADLESLGLRSAYHAVTGEALGKESMPTLWHMWNADKPYHIDYCYTSAPVAAVDVGGSDEWLPPSDHAPVVVALRGHGDVSREQGGTS